MVTIYWAGDSTAAQNSIATWPQTGIGQEFERFLRGGVRVENFALNGRSTKSFMDEGHLDAIAAQIQEGDFLFIQFGHNDEKDAPELHTDPDSTYPEFLSWYCDEAISRGAQPVLITPVSRRWWIPGPEMLYTHGEYPAAVRKLAAERNIPLVDLKTTSRNLYLELGEEKCAELFVVIPKGENPDFPEGHNDKTHFNAYGAEKIAGLVVDSLRTDARTAKYVK